LSLWFLFSLLYHFDSISDIYQRVPIVY
jgi:hypothetical protein